MLQECVQMEGKEQKAVEKLRWVSFVCFIYYIIDLYASAWKFPIL